MTSKNHTLHLVYLTQTRQHSFTCKHVFPYKIIMPRNAFPNSFLDNKNNVIHAIEYKRESHETLCGNVNVCQHVLMSNSKESISLYII